MGSFDDLTYAFPSVAADIVEDTAFENSTSITSLPNTAVGILDSYTFTHASDATDVTTIYAASVNIYDLLVSLVNVLI